MDRKEKELLKHLLPLFRVEAKEHIDAITSGLIELEKAPPKEQTGIIETIFREAHSLKGAAGTVNQKEIESMCMSIESVFSALKRKERQVSQQMLDVLHSAADCISDLMSKDEITEQEKSKVKENIRRLEKLLKGAMPSRKAKPVQEPEITPHVKLDETIRISTSKLDSLLFQAEEMLSVKLAASQRISEINEINRLFALWKKDWEKLRIEMSTFETKGAQNAGKLSELLDSNDARFKTIGEKLNSLENAHDSDYKSLGGMVDNLLEDMKKVLMLPFSSLLDMFPKLVRDLSHSQNKEVELVIHGQGIEIDRRILEEMKDPLIHLIRNCIDHGIEKPQERIKKNKKPQGIIKIDISAKEGGKIEIDVSDDGAGIDASSVKNAAVKRGIISTQEEGKLSEQEIFSLIFHSGVSTSPIITKISGRGLGLAIVREKVEKLNGIVSFDTKPDAGTTFHIIIPLTLATFRGLIVDANEQIFVIPTTNVERALRIKKEEIKTIENRETISLNGRIISLVRMAEVLEIAGGRNISDDYVQIAILGSAEKRMAFTVDKIVQEQEVLVKNLGKQLIRVRNISGAVVLGAGKPVPILNVHDLIKSGVKFTLPKIKHEIKKDTRIKSILVVDDSITARTLLKNILELAGYDVKTAVDGAEAFALLKTHEFDLVVSDVTMPKMNGLELTSKIRSDARLSQLPVILVTALESREDMERGIEVGANAYIVKSSFDQSNLFEVISRLI